MGKNKILEMSADELYEVDGVVFDADSYARYLRHCEAAEEMPQQAPAAAESLTFCTEPQHIGWYPEGGGQPPVPIMAGAVPPAVLEEVPAPLYFVAPVRTVEVIRIPVAGQQTLVYGGGSGSGSYLTSFTTSFFTSYRYGSGSSSFFSSGSCIWGVGGYGLELI